MAEIAKKLRTAQPEPKVTDSYKKKRVLLLIDVGVSLVEPLSKKDANVKNNRLDTEYDDFTWECNQLANFPTSFLESRMRKAQFLEFCRKRKAQFWSFTGRYLKMQI